jgi:hypothetical protein
MGSNITVGEFFGAIGNGLGSLIGLGDLFPTNISRLNDSLADAKDLQTKTFQNLVTITINKDIKLQEDIIQWINVNNETLLETEKLQNVIINGRISKQNDFLSIIALLVIIILFFMIIKKKCC